MTDKTSDEALRDRNRQVWLLWVTAFALPAATAVGTLYFRQLPWLTALSALFLVALVIAGVSRSRKLPPQQLWGVLLGFALVLYFGSLAYQAEVPARGARYQAWATPQLTGSPGNLILAIAYPRIVPLEAPDKPGWPLSVYLWPPVLPVTVTATTPVQTPTPVALTWTLASMPNSITPTPTLVIPTPIPTPTQPTSYTVTFVPYDNGLLFTDEKGVPVAPRVMVSPGEYPDKPAVLYVRQALTGTASISVPVTVQVYEPSGNLQELTVLDLHLEDDYNAWWRHFFDLVLGPTTPLLALAATLIGFGWQWWQEGQKRKQAQLDEIEQVKTLVDSGKLEEARPKLAEVTRRYGKEPGLRDALTEAKKCVFLERIRRLKSLARVNRVEALRQYTELQEEIKREGRKDPELVATLRDAEVAIKLQPLRWLELWPDKEQRHDHPAITAWLRESDTDLTFNPFGPERAEEDPLLPQMFVEPPGWQQMKAPEPTVVFGTDGSGRTASLLLLAHTCTTTGLGLDRIGGQIDTFPVRLPLFPEGKPAEATVTCWRMLTRAVAQATLDFLARNSQAFIETPSHQQRRALARLFAMHRDYLGDFIEYLEGAGLDRLIAAHLAENIQRTAQGTQPPALTDEVELLATLAEARLLLFQQHYVLVEVPVEAPNLLAPEGIASRLRPLLQMMLPLAARKVYLKLFIPANVKHLLAHLPSHVNKVELSWDTPRLREMLERRVQQAGAASFKALFRHLPETIDPTALLVQEALKSEGPPRRLVQLGQELLTEHVRRAPAEPKLRWEDLKAVLEEAAQGGGR